MPDRQPESWESSVGGPFSTRRRQRGTIEVWALFSDRFSVRAPERNEQIVFAHDAAMATATELAAKLD